MDAASTYQMPIMNIRLVTPDLWLKPEQFPQADRRIAQLQGWGNLRIRLTEDSKHYWGDNPDGHGFIPVYDYCQSILPMLRVVKSLPSGKREDYLYALTKLLSGAKLDVSEFDRHNAPSDVRATAYLIVMAPEFFEEAQP